MKREDYIILKTNNEALCFENGDIIIYGDKEEAEEDKTNGEKVIAIPRYLTDNNYNINFYLKKTLKN